jgi:hypothetical protein
MQFAIQSHFADWVASTPLKCENEWEHLRGRPTAQGSGKCGATTRHSVSVKSVGIV